MELSHSGSLFSTYQNPLVNLGDSLKDDNLEGIFSPVYSEEEVAKFMTAHYSDTEKARHQFDSFDKLAFAAYYSGLLDRAISAVGMDTQKPTQVLELGAGFGSFTFPLLEKFSNAKIIGSEFSIAMLSLLKEQLAKKGIERGRCQLMQLNAEQLDFQSNSFDIVTGAALLHHLFHPEKVFEACARILKSGGFAIFFEPFENGTDILAMIYREFLRDPRVILRRRRMLRYLSSMAKYWKAMATTPKDNPFFQGQDDKFLFTKSQVADLAQQFDFSRHWVLPLDESKRPFENAILYRFKEAQFPPPDRWMMKIIDRYENAFSENMKRDLLIEGCLILQK